MQYHSRFWENHTIFNGINTSFFGFLISFITPHFLRKTLFLTFEERPLKPRSYENENLEVMRTKHFLGLCTLLGGMLLASSCVVHRTGPKPPPPPHEVDHHHKKKAPPPPKKHHDKHKPETPPPPPPPERW